MASEEGQSAVLIGIDTCNVAEEFGFDGVYIDKIMPYRQYEAHSGQEDEGGDFLQAFPRLFFRFQVILLFCGSGRIKWCCSRRLGGVSSCAREQLCEGCFALILIGARRSGRDPAVSIICSILSKHLTQLPKRLWSLLSYPHLSPDKPGPTPPRQESWHLSTRDILPDYGKVYETIVLIQNAGLTCPWRIRVTLFVSERAVVRSNAAVYVAVTL